MKLNKLFLASLVGSQVVNAALADNTNSVPATGETDIKALKQQIQELDQKVRVLERKQENDQDDAAAKSKTAPKFSLGPNGFTISSADTNFVVGIHGLIQIDSRTFEHDNNVAGNDSILLRRARPIISGTLFHDFDFQFVPEFGGGSASSATTPGIYDAYINYRFSPEIQIQAGKFKSPVGLEQLQSDPYTSFNERSLATDLTPNRDLGFELHGDLFLARVSYFIGIFNGVGDSRNSNNTDFDNNRDFAGRIFAQPFKGSSIDVLQGLGVGLGGDYSQSSTTNSVGLPNITGGTLAGYATDGQQQFFAYNPASGTVFADKTHWRLSPQGYYYYGPFSVLGEYVISDQIVRRVGVAPLTTADLQNTAWEITGGWVLTGEDATFNGVTPRRPFNPHNGNWGAVQFVARYAELDIDKKAFPNFANPNTSASEAQSWAAGLNWYLNRNIRVNASFSHTWFTGGGTSAASAPGAVTTHDENVIFTRIQLAF